MHFLSHLPYIASSVPGTSQQQGRDSVHQQKGLSHTQRGFSGPFFSIWRHGLCSSAMLIASLSFHFYIFLSLLSSHFCYIYMVLQAGFLLCLGRISSVFDLRISLPQSAADSFSSWDCSFQSAPIHWRSLDLDMSQPKSQLWAGFDLHMGSHCLHFFFSLASLLVLLGFLSP